jgi:hypothetical protein
LRQGPNDSGLSRKQYVSVHVFSVLRSFTSIVCRVSPLLNGLQNLYFPSSSCSTALRCFLFTSPYALYSDPS